MKNDINNLKNEVYGLKIKINEVDDRWKMVEDNKKLT